MSEKTQITTREQEQQAIAQSGAREREAVLRPNVDIFEDDSGITLHADMPGVSRERLSVNVEGDVLSIKGDADIPMPEGMEPLYADVRATRYERNFTLSREMDTEQVEASLNQGVLTLRIPKREEHKPRKIEVKVG